MGFFDALAEFFQPLLNAIGLGPGHGDSGRRFKLPFRHGRAAWKQRAAMRGYRRFEAARARAIMAAQRTSLARPSRRNPALMPSVLARKRRP